MKTVLSNKQNGMKAIVRQVARHTYQVTVLADGLVMTKSQYDSVDEAFDVAQDVIS